MRGGRTRRALAVVGMVLTLVGCSQPTSGSTSGHEIPTPTIDGSEPDLRKERVAAGIADCPVTDPNASAVEGGLPALTLTCLGGGSTVALAGLKGPLVINFWAQWCGPCRDEAPVLAKASSEYKGKVTFIGVDTSDPRPELAIAFAKEVGWTYPQVRDATGDQVRKPPLQANNLPMTLMVDASGRIVVRHPGLFTSSEEFDQMVATKLGVKK